jgi:hypothetical protein
LLCRPWLSARTPVAAADELIAVAESVSGSARLTALGLARECGSAAAPAWRDWATSEGIGAYARIWLAEQDGTEPAADDEAWITVDAITTLLDTLPPGLPIGVLGSMLQAEMGVGMAEIVPLLADSGHPAAPRLVSLLTGRPAGRRAKAPRRPRAVAPGRVDSTYQIKVQLRDVTKPPVWRRLLVPADVTLDRLHGVIQRAMGWKDCHLHAFSDGSAEYGVPDGELGYRDERRTRLSQLLAAVGDKIDYSYDFGDDWAHDITLEKLLPADPAAHPVCTAGKGACPPEDCGGPWGYETLKATLSDPGAEEHAAMLEWLGLRSADEFDPAAFSVEDVNRGLG